MGSKGCVEDHLCPIKRVSSLNSKKEVIGIAALLILGFGMLCPQKDAFFRLIICDNEGLISSLLMLSPVIFFFLPAYSPAPGN